MRKKNIDIVPEVNREQLLGEHTFLEHCKNDYHGKSKLKVNLEFLRAAKEDGFISPILQVKETTRQEDGKENEEVVDYYSPHQIYVITALVHNQLHEGLLWGDIENLEFYKQQGFRMVHWGWGGYAFNITQAKQGSNTNSDFNHLQHCMVFHDFLRLLHSFGQRRDYSVVDQNKERHFTAAPSLQFDFSLLKGKGTEVLGKFNLTSEKLKILMKNIGHLATEIDPLEYWYYYIKLHPQWRKDLFKGDAIIAQELYAIYDLISKVHELVTTEKQPPLPELLYVGWASPYLMPKAEYAEGTDVKALWAVVDRFEKWAHKSENAVFVEKTTLEKLVAFKRDLKDYEERYGDRNYVSATIREVEREEEIELEQLDSNVQGYVEQFMKDYASIRQGKDGKDYFVTRDEIMEMLAKKEIEQKQAEELDYQFELQERIAMAIEWRLSDMQRNLYSILNEVGGKLQKETSDAWDKANNFSQWLWLNKNQEIKGLSTEEHQELYRVEQDKARKSAEEWGKKRDEFSDIEHDTRLVFCRNCRGKPVVLHYRHNDQQVSTEPICDDCIKNTQNLRDIKPAEFKCTHCGALLYKYAYQNTLNDLLFNQQPADITVVLEYGRLEVQLRCKRCKELNKRWIDWGWTS